MLVKASILAPIFGLLIALSAWGQMPIRPDPALEQSFRPFQTGWIGADGIYSVPLNSGRTLWLFGDTLLGKISQGRRQDVQMIHNSLALQEGENWQYYWNPPGQPDILKAPEPETWFWPGPGIVWRDKLYLILPAFKQVPGPEGFGFSQTATYLARVENIQGPLRTWHWTYQRLDWGLEKQSYSVAAMADQGYFYVYGYSDRQENQAVKRDALLLRLALEQLGRQDLTPSYWDGKGWNKQADQAKALFTGYQSEGSIHYLPSEKKYSLIYTAPGLSAQVYQRLALQPTGPWSEPTVIFEYPEMQNTSDFFCYAAKNHPQLQAHDREVVLSYACNALHFDDLFKNPHIYLPRFFRLTP